MGRLIPAGTGFEYYRHVRIPADEPPPPPAPPQPSDDELELERDMEYFVEPEEALGPRTGDLGEWHDARLTCTSKIGRWLATVTALFTVP